MYILIDRHQLAIIHKHPDPNVLRLLAWIECENFATIAQIGSAKQLMEDIPANHLFKVYKAATGGDMNPYSTRVTHALFEAAKRMPVTNAKLEEVEAQARHVKDGSPPIFRFRAGAAEPDKLRQPYIPPALKVSRIESDETYAFTPTVTRAEQPQGQAIPPLPSGAAPWTRPKVASNVVIAPAAPGMIKRPWEK